LILLDTTVLLFAFGTGHELDEPARRLIEAITDGRLRATTTVAVIEEFVHVHSRYRSRHEAVQLGSRYIDLLGPLVVSSEDALRRSLPLFDRHRQVGAFDAVLAATTMEIGAEALVSGDGGFASIPSLPFVPLIDVEQLLA
jgi:uncharacterized protein